ncbi:MAG: Hsp20/alpha crystallin family protein [Melioribacteraceae bacterium]|jgi:HSP20 family protein|nr:Hsp20/alpha crystallin family protein [Melioribacteraceae bacterium]
MTLIKFEPIREFESLHNRLQRYLEDFPTLGFNTQDSFSPRIDISETNDKLLVTAEIPGVKKNDLKITLQDNILTIQGEKKKETENKDINYYRAERNFGMFGRSFTLPVEVDSENVSAKFEDGTLVVELSKILPKAKTEKTIELK